MPEGTFVCDACGHEISNPPRDPKYCAHAFQCGLLRLCRLTQTTCEYTKELGYCTHDGIDILSPPQVWPVHKVVNKSNLVPWDLVNDKAITNVKATSSEPKADEKKQMMLFQRACGLRSSNHAF